MNRDALLRRLALETFECELRIGRDGETGPFAPAYDNPLRRAGISINAALAWVTSQLGEYDDPCDDDGPDFIPPGGVIEFDHQWKASERRREEDEQIGANGLV